MEHDHNKKLENHLAMSQEDYKHHKGDVMKTTIILSIITISEVAFALFYEAVLVPKYGLTKGPLRLVLVVMSLLKAYWIMAVFMHVKHEKKAMILSITLPFTLLIWMIISFIWDGDCYSELINKRFGKSPVHNTEVVHEK